MKTLELMLEDIENDGISIDNYEENNKLCGYELNTYTNGGVNQIIFLDFRDSKYDPFNAEHFAKVFKERITSIDIDDEIMLNRQDERYKADFTLSESLSDFTEWKGELLNLVDKINS